MVVLLNMVQSVTLNFCPYSPFPDFIKLFVFPYVSML